MTQKAEILEFLKHQSISKNFTDSELALFYELTELELYEAGKTIFEENETSRNFYIIINGRIDLLKWDADKQYLLQIGKLEKGEMFGEMAFLDGQPRSSEVKAATTTTLLKIPQTILDDETPEIKDIYNKIIRNIATVNLNRLRQSNQNYVQSLRTQIEELNLKNNFGLLFILSIMLMGFVNIMEDIVKNYGINTYNPAYSWGYLLIMLLPFLYLIRRFGYPLSELGVTLKNWKKSITEGLIATAIFVAIVMIIYEIYAWRNPSAPTLYYAITHPVKVLDFITVIYIIHSYIQEFMGRGVLQTSLNKFMGEANSTRAVIVTSVMFGMAHVQRGLGAGAVAFVASLVFGFLYIRSHNLLGVTILHFIGGVLAIHYLGLV